MIRVCTQKEMKMNNYEKIRSRLNSILEPLKEFDGKLDIIREKISSSLSNDNMGIYSSEINNPTLRKMEVIDKLEKEVAHIKEVLESNKDKLTDEEKICLDELILHDCTTEELAELLNCGYKRTVKIKKSTYIKVARWFGIIELNEDYILGYMENINKLTQRAL